MVETHVHLSPHTPAGDPPEPEELIKAIQDLENNVASADEGVRQRIAQLPTAVTEISSIASIEGRFIISCYKPPYIIIIIDHISHVIVVLVRAYQPNFSLFEIHSFYLLLNTVVLFSFYR